MVTRYWSNVADLRCAARSYRIASFRPNPALYLLIKNNVKVNSDMGNIDADKLFFDLKMQKLNIGSFQNNNINANIKINEKRF